MAIPAKSKVSRAAQLIELYLAPTQQASSTMVPIANVVQPEDFIDPFSEASIEDMRHCPVCASTAVVYSASATDKLFSSSPRVWLYYRCKHCCSLYLHNRPKPEFVHLAYANYYTHGATTGPVNSHVNDLLARYLAADKNNTFFARLVTAIPPIRSFFDAKTKGISQKEPGRLFDFGCGNGNFLKLSSGIGWVSHGCDFDRSAVEAARQKGLSVTHGGVDALERQPNDYFDLITLSHVIEHLHEPNALLAVCKKKLREGGTLWIETPNANARGFELFGPNWRGLEPPRHLQLYSQKALSFALETEGFQEIEIMGHFLSGAYIFVQSAKLEASRLSFVWRTTAAVRGLLHDLYSTINPAQSEFLTLTCKK